MPQSLERPHPAPPLRTAVRAVSGAGANAHSHEHAGCFCGCACAFLPPMLSHGRASLVLTRAAEPVACACTLSAGSERSPVLAMRPSGSLLCRACAPTRKASRGMWRCSAPQSGRGARPKMTAPAGAGLAPSQGCQERAGRATFSRRAVAPGPERRIFRWRRAVLVGGGHRGRQPAPCRCAAAPRATPRRAPCARGRPGVAPAAPAAPAWLQPRCWGLGARAARRGGRAGRVARRGRREVRR